MLVCKLYFLNIRTSHVVALMLNFCVTFGCSLEVKVGKKYASEDA